MAYKMAVSPTLIVLVLVLVPVSVVVSEATNLEGEGICPALGYWNLKLPNTSIPNALREAICPHTTADHLFHNNIQEDGVKSGDVSISSQKYIATPGGGDLTIYSHKYFLPQVDDVSISSQTGRGDATIYSHKYFTTHVGDISLSSQKYIPPSGRGDATLYGHKYIIPQVGDVSVSSHKYSPAQGGDATLYSHKYNTPQEGDVSVSSHKYSPAQGGDATLYSHKYNTPQVGDVSISGHKYIPAQGGDATLYSHKYNTPQEGDVSVSSHKYSPAQGGDATLYSHKYNTPQVGDVSISGHKYIPAQGGDATLYSHKYNTPQEGDVSVFSHKYSPGQGGDATLYSHKYNTPQEGDVSVSSHKYSPVQGGDATLYNRKYIIDRHSSPKRGDITLAKDPNQKNVEYHRQLLAIDPLLSIFFFEKDLHIGTNLMVHLEALKAHNLASFIPRSISNEIPFSSEKLLASQDMLKIPQGSLMSIAMQKTLKTCESPTIKGETTYCATSMESMIDYSTAQFGSNELNVLVTDLPSNFNSENHQYSVSAMFTKSNSSSKHVICHNLVYPYAIYMCHESKGTKIFELSLKGQGTYGCPVPVVAICHADTSGWNPDHAAFVALNVKPGEEGICHFMLEGTIAWLLAN